MNIFFDSSAWAKRYIAEKGSDEIESICLKAENVTLSILCIPEIISAFTRLKREGKVTLNQYKQLQKSLYKDIEDVRLINISLEIISYAVNLIKQYPLRTLDALHIACAKFGKVDLFITSDYRQSEAAKGIDLQVELID
jgi:predicted nucleic acid-binding protein